MTAIKITGYLPSHNAVAAAKQLRESCDYTLKHAKLTIENVLTGRLSYLIVKEDAGNFLAEMARNGFTCEVIN